MFGLLQIAEEQYSESIIKTEGFLSTMEFGLQMLLLGMGTVFAVLALLWGCLSVFKFVFYDLKNKTKSHANEETSQTSAISDSETASKAEDDEEIIAVIAAAIAAAESEAPGLKFRVVAFNRK